MDRLELLQDNLSPWAQKMIVSVLLALSIHFIIIPLLGGRRDRLGEYSNFGGTGEALDQDWTPQKGTRQNGAKKSILLRDTQAFVPSSCTHGGNESQGEDITLGERAVFGQTQAKESSQSDAKSGDSMSESKETKPAAPQGHRRQQERERVTPPERTRPKLKSTGEHPGLGAFHVWHSAIADIYRSYTVGKNDGSTPALPIIPRSERGNVPVHLEVTNLTSAPFDVFWVDYKGNEDYKGSAAPGSTWFQQTWIGHPWTFRAPGGKVLLHFVPFRVIQNTARMNTTNRYNEGLQRFSILPPSYEGQKENFICDVEDPIFSFPSTKFKSQQKAFDWSCSHMERERSSPRAVLKYLKNVLKNPDNPKYRQIRTANKTFWNEVWITAARGMLHALGFEENGAYVEMGSEEGALPAERIKQISSAVSALEALLHDIEGVNGSTATEQPEGADGFGRAGFGRLGMN